MGKKTNFKEAVAALSNYKITEFNARVNDLAIKSFKTVKAEKKQVATQKVTGSSYVSATTETRQDDYDSPSYTVSTGGGWESYEDEEPVYVTIPEHVILIIEKEGRLVFLDMLNASKDIYPGAHNVEQFVNIIFDGKDLGKATDKDISNAVATLLALCNSYFNTPERKQDFLTAAIKKVGSQNENLSNAILVHTPSHIAQERLKEEEVKRLAEEVKKLAEVARVKAENEHKERVDSKVAEIKTEHTEIAQEFWGKKDKALSPEFIAKCKVLDGLLGWIEDDGKYAKRKTEDDGSVRVEMLNLEDKSNILHQAVGDIARIYANHNKHNINYAELAKTAALNGNDAEVPNLSSETYKTTVDFKVDEKPYYCDVTFKRYPNDHSQDYNQQRQNSHINNLYNEVSRLMQTKKDGENDSWKKLGRDIKEMRESFQNYRFLGKDSTGVCRTTRGMFEKWDNLHTEQGLGLEGKLKSKDAPKPQ